jgi:hypothetical protein
MLGARAYKREATSSILGDGKDDRIEVGAEKGGVVAMRRLEDGVIIGTPSNIADAPSNRATLCSTTARGRSHPSSGGAQDPLSSPPMHPAATTAAAPRAPRRASLEEWLAIPEERRAELIDGHLVYQHRPGPVHGVVQGGIVALLRVPYHRRAGGAGGPGGWWILLEVDMELGGMGCRPDLLGRRRDKQPKLPMPEERGLVTAVPDWICELPLADDRPPRPRRQAR